MTRAKSLDWNPVSVLPKLQSVYGWEESDRILLWISNSSTKLAFGHARRFGHKRITWQAEGFSREGWEITHWCYLPKGPE